MLIGKSKQPIVNLERKGMIYKLMLLRDSTIALELNFILRLLKMKKKSVFLVINVILLSLEN